MILYFDNYITNTPLIQNFYTELDKIRSLKTIYSLRDKLDVTLYTLVSYSYIKWSKVIIVYELEDPSKKEYFESFVKKLFPRKKLILHYGRSDTQEKYQKWARIMNSFKENWIFYAGNNDHPFIAPNTKTLSLCLKKAEELAKKHKFVSIFPTHFSEGLNFGKKGVAIHDLKYTSTKILSETRALIVYFFGEAFQQSQIILNKNLFNFIVDANLKKSIYKRIEDMVPEAEPVPQLVICPKEIIFEHFDGYSHTIHSGFSIPSKIVPPLFIPPGFFEKKIKIRYGYEDYKEGWVNINPLKEQYIFESPSGTDLKISLDQIPLFWKKRIKIIDINKKADLKALKNAAEKNFELVKMPFKSKKDRGYNFHLLKYRIKRRIYDSDLMHPLFLLYKKNKLVKKIHSKINRCFFSD